MATALFNEWFIHTGPRIRLSASVSSYRSGMTMYYKLNTTIHGLDYRQSWYGWYLDMAVYIGGKYMGTTRLKQNQPNRWTVIRGETPYYGISAAGGSLHIKVVITSNKPAYGSRVWETENLPVDALSGSGMATIDDVTENSAVMNITNLPTGYDKHMEFEFSRNGTSWESAGASDLSYGSSTCSKAVTGLTSGAGYYIRAKEYVSGAYVTSFTNWIVLPKAKAEIKTVAGETHIAATVEMNSETPYQRTLEWFYRVSGAETYIPAGVESVPPGAARTEKRLSALTTGCRYDIKVIMKRGGDVLAESETSETLLPSSAEITAVSESYSTITVSIKGMVPAGWARSIFIDCKAKEDAEYRRAYTGATAQNEFSTVIKNLKAYKEYDVRVVMKQTAFVIASADFRVKTLEMGFVATPVIKGITSILGTCNALVTWYAPDDREEMKYDVEYRDQDGVWKKLKTMEDVQPVEITLPAGNKAFPVRIKGYATDSEKVAYSNEYEIYTLYKFEYDSAVEAGREIRLNTEEVNRLIKFVERKSGKAVVPVIPKEKITTDKHNEMRLAIGLVPLSEKETIMAEHWILLKDTVNRG